MPLPLSILLQIADSAFPTGAFAYSNGLEALARAGKFPDAEALESYLDAYVRQAGEFDLAFVAAAHASGEEGDDAGFARLCREWDATFWNHPVRVASLRQARALIDALAETFPHADLADLRRAASAETLHFAPAMGRALARLGASREQACEVYLHGLMRDQAAAALRLGLLGPRATQGLQARVLARSTERLRGTRPAPWTEARRSAPLAEAGQGGHGFLYSRLFQN
jgi:urease accessory protein